MRIELFQFTGVAWCEACHQQITSADYPINAWKDSERNFLFHLGCDPRIHQNIRDRVYGMPRASGRKPNNFIPGYQSPKQQKESNTLAMDAIYQKMIEFFQGDPLLYDANDGSITARVLAAETMYDPADYQPAGLLITLKDAKRTQYVLRIARADLTRALPPMDTTVEVTPVKPKALPSHDMATEEAPEHMTTAAQPNEPDDLGMPESELILAISESFRKTAPPDYWMVLPFTEHGAPRYDLALQMGEYPSIQNAISYADAYLGAFPTHRVIILEGFKNDAPFPVVE